MTEVKSIEYAYPTSEIAQKLGREKTGCYVIKTGPTMSSGGQMGVPFDTLDEAREYADTLDLPWCPMYSRHPLR